jgi:HAD superfamily hydrolase (TIGR01509 family)
MKYYVFDLDDTLLETSKLLYNYQGEYLTEQQVLHDYKKIIHKDENLYSLLLNLKGKKYILTNSGPIHCHVSLKNLGIESLFSGFIDNTSVKGKLAFKPYPPVYNYTKEVMGVSRDDEIFIFDDRIENLVYPASIGWKTVLICKASSFDKNFQPNYTFKDIYTALEYFISNEI